MFANVANSSEMQLAEGFFKEFTTPDMKYFQTQDDLDIVDGRDENFELVGQCVFLQFWFNHIMLVPDMTWRFTNTKIVTQLHSKQSRVEFNFDLYATMLYDLHFMDSVPTQTEQETILQQQTTIKLLNKNKRKVTQSITQLPQYNHRMVDQISYATMLNKPQKLKLSGRMIMYLNEEKRIIKMNFHCLGKVLT
jgi:hypothetical protein